MKHAFYSKEFIDQLSSDPLEGVTALCERFFEVVEHNNDIELEQYLDALAATQAYCEARAVDCKPIILPDDVSNCYGSIQEWMRHLLIEKKRIF